MFFPSESDQKEPGRSTPKEARILVVGTGLSRPVVGPTSQEARSAETLVAIWGGRNLMYGHPDEMVTDEVHASLRQGLLERC